MSISINDNFNANAPKILDNRYSANGVTPYVSIAAANLAIPISQRALGLTVLIGSDEYWYKAGITDPDLVLKSIVGVASLPIVQYVYLVADASDALRMGGVASNVYTDMQSAWDAALAIATISFSYKVEISVGVITAAQAGNLTITTAGVNASDRIILKGLNNRVSIIGNITTTGGNNFTLNASDIQMGNLSVFYNCIINYSSNFQILNIINIHGITFTSCNWIKIVGAITLTGGIITDACFVQMYESTYMRLGDISGNEVGIDLGATINGSFSNHYLIATVINNLTVTNTRHHQFFLRGVTFTGNLTYSCSFVSTNSSPFVIQNTKVNGTTTILKTGQPGITNIESCSFQDIIFTGSTFTSLALTDCTTRQITGLPAGTALVNTSVYCADLRRWPASPQLLVVGQRYKILLYVAGDNFTNVGGTNVTGNVFVATGTTPTSWLNGSILQINEMINVIGANCEMYNTSIVGGALAIDNGSAVSVKFTSGFSSAKAPMGVNITLT